MVKASDNEFPKVILKPLGLASAPADASWKLYPMADGVYARSSNSIVGPLGAGGSGAVATDVIWDAAGDLAVGTGANTAARLAAGAAGGVLAMGNSAVIWNAGTAFPASKATNDRYWRTDLGMEFYYDGTRWLSTTLFVSAGNGMFGVSATGPTVRVTAFAALYDIYVVDLLTTLFVLTPNDGTQYWTVTVQKVSTGGTGTDLGSVNTSADTVGTFTPHRASVNAAVATATYPAIDFSLSKTSTPGNLYGGMSYSYRLIGV